MRVKYTNGSVNQGTMRLQTINYYNSNNEIYNNITDEIIDSTNVSVVKSVLVGKHLGGTYDNIKRQTTTRLRNKRIKAYILKRIEEEEKPKIDVDIGFVDLS